MTRPVTSHWTTGGVAVIAAPESFDMCTARPVRELTIQLQRDGATGVVIDLAAVTFMDTTALAVIVGAHNRLSSAGSPLAVAAASGPVTRMFRVTGLTRLIPMHATVQDAIDSIQAQESQ